MSYRIAVIGQGHAVRIFRLLGFDVYEKQDSQEASECLDELASRNYGVIYLTERLAEGMLDQVRKYDAKKLPAVILIPDHTGSEGLGLARLEENVEKAVGENIINRER